MGTGVHARRANVSFRDVTIKIPDRGCDQGCEWRDVTGHRGLRFEKNQLVEILPRRKTVDFPGSPKPSQWPCGRCHTWFGADGKVNTERWYLSPYIEKPFNSKVIKSFVPELRSRKCFCLSGFLCYIYVCVMDIMNVLRTGMNMSISHFHIWLCNMWSYLLFR